MANLVSRKETFQSIVCHLISKKQLQKAIIEAIFKAKKVNLATLDLKYSHNFGC